MKYVNIDTSDAGRFFDALEAAARGGFRKELELFLEALGFEFLAYVQDEIIRRNAMTEARLLLASFEKDDSGNVWKSLDGGLTLEVGTNLEYAKWVNDGHRQQPGRFVPGYWEEKPGKAVFVYDKTAESGMILKTDWVDGKHYFDGALYTMEKIAPEFLDKKLQEWLDSYF